MEEQLFSVVILSYNQESYLYDGIDSVLEQDYASIQLIISDDASESFDSEKIKNYIEQNKRQNIKSVLINTNKNNLGIAANCDAALPFCTGKYVLFLDGDDCLADCSAITNICNEFDSLPKEAMVVTGNVFLCDKNLENEAVWLKKETIEEKNNMTSLEQFKELFTDFWPVPSATAYKRVLFDQMGGFKSYENRLIQDGYFFLHLTRNGIKINVVDCFIAKHRAGGLCFSEPTSKESICIRTEILKIAEIEIFPYSNVFSSKEMDAICERYYENMIGLLLASNEEYLISEPAYSLVADWADRNGVVWCYDKSNYDYNKHYEKHRIRKAFASIKERV